MNDYIIRNVRYFDGSDTFKYGDIVIKDGVYVHCGRLEEWLQSQSPAGTNHTAGITDTTNLYGNFILIEGTGLTAIPGLVDIHTHGCGGADICDKTYEAIDTLIRCENAHGTAYFLPATMTLPEDELCDILHVFSSYKNDKKKSYENYHTTDNCCTESCYTSYLHTDDSTAGNRHGSNAADSMPGIYLEGPFLNPDRCGAQDASNIVPASMHTFMHLIKSAMPHQSSEDLHTKKSGTKYDDFPSDTGYIRIMAVAPEYSGNMSFIRSIHRLYGNSLIISAGHTCCDYNTCMEAFNAGVSHMTHLFNAMPGLIHRKPGPIAAASDYRNCTVELICDGTHIDDAMIRLAFKIFSPDKIIFISDSMRAAGCPDGLYTLGGQNVIKNGHTAVLASDNTIAGSVSYLSDCLKHAVCSAGIRPETAVACATLNPARLLGMDNYGAIKPQMTAKLILLNNEWDIVRVLFD